MTTADAYEEEQKKHDSDVLWELWTFFDWVTKNHPDIYQEYLKSRGSKT